MPIRGGISEAASFFCCASFIFQSLKIKIALACYYSPCDGRRADRCGEKISISLLFAFALHLPRKNLNYAAPRSLEYGRGCLPTGSY